MGQARVAAAKANARLLLSVSVVVVALLVGIELMPLPTWVQGFLVGIYLAGLVTFLAIAVNTAAGAQNRVFGQIGEEATGSLVDNRWRRRKGWRTVHGLFFKGHGDVDHVLLGPGGIYVIESKWTSKPWEICNGELVGPPGRDPIEQARSGAEKIEHLLRYGSPRLDVSVHPVLVLWGPGAPELIDGCQSVAGVEVIEGRRGRRCRRAFERTTLDPDLVEEATHRLLRQDKSQADHRLKA